MNWPGLATRNVSGVVLSSTVLGNVGVLKGAKDSQSADETVRTISRNLGLMGDYGKDGGEKRGSSLRCGTSVKCGDWVKFR